MLFNKLILTGNLLCGIFVLCFRKGMKWKRAILKTHRLLQGSSSALHLHTTLNTIPPLGTYRRISNRIFDI